MNEVTVACPCPGTPHTEDTLTLHPEATFEIGMAVRQSIGYAVDAGTADASELDVVIGRAYLDHAIAAWTCVDDEGAPLPPSTANVRRLIRWPAAEAIVDAASVLYGEAVLRPLVERASRLSAAGPTARSTSVTPLRPVRTRRRSGSSSTRTSAAS